MIQKQRTELISDKDLEKEKEKLKAFYENYHLMNKLIPKKNLEDDGSAQEEEEEFEEEEQQQVFPNILGFKDMKDWLYNGPTVTLPAE